MTVSADEYDAWMKGDPYAHKKIREGIRAWNKWVIEQRRTNPTFRPNLNSLSFDDPSWQETPLWRRGYGIGKSICLFEGLGIEAANFEPIDLCGAYLNWVRFRNVHMPGAIMVGAEIAGAELEDVYLRYADFRGVNAHQSSMRHVDFLGADLRRAILFETELNDSLLANCSMQESDLRECDLRNSTLSESDLRAVKLTNARMDGANVFGVRYDVRAMDGRYRGIGGVDQTYGNSLWRRDALDQDYLDTLTYEWSLGWLEEVRFPLPPPWSSGSRAMATLRAVFWPLIVFAAVFVTAWRNIPGGSWRPTLRWCTLPARYLYSLLVNGIVKGALILSWWALGWGRSLLRVAALGAIFVVLIGFWYSSLCASGELRYSSDLSIPIFLPRVGQVDLRPWFAAVMGFCTLGLTGLVSPVTALSASAMIANVLTGFITIGLLIAVAGNKFARRS